MSSNYHNRPAAVSGAGGVFITGLTYFVIISNLIGQWKITNSVNTPNNHEGGSVPNIFNGLVYNTENVEPVPSIDPKIDLLASGGPFAPAFPGDPFFDASVPRNVTALVGKTAYLSCRVRNLGNRTVSWVRHRDIHILTVATYTYTSDQRFQAIHQYSNNDEWTLQIKYTQKRDAGIYECQISAQPHRSFYLNLNVVVPTATILGGPDLHVDKGSMINLTCLIKYSPEPPSYIFWYHYDDAINYNSERGGVSVITEKGETTTSYLLIQDARVTDSGKYSCSPSNADIASVRVHVLNGERPAAMQTGSASRILNQQLLIISVLSSLFSWGSSFSRRMKCKLHEIVLHKCTSRTSNLNLNST